MTIIEDLKQRYHLAVASVTGIYTPFNSYLKTHKYLSSPSTKEVYKCTVEDPIISYPEQLGKTIIDASARCISVKDNKMMLVDKDKVTLQTEADDIVFYHKIDSDNIDVVYDEIDDVVVTYDKKSRQMIPYDVTSRAFLYHTPVIIDTDDVIKDIHVYRGNVYLYTENREIYVYSIVGKDIVHIIDVDAIPGKNYISTSMDNGIITIGSYTDSTVYISRVIIDQYNIITPMIYTDENFTLDNGMVPTDIFRIISKKGDQQQTYIIGVDGRVSVGYHVYDTVAIDDHDLYDKVSYELTSPEMLMYDGEEVPLNIENIGIDSYKILHDKILKINIEDMSVTIAKDDIILSSNILFQSPLTTNKADNPDIKIGIITVNHNDDNTHTLQCKIYRRNDNGVITLEDEYQLLMNNVDYTSMKIIPLQSFHGTTSENILPLGCVLLCDENIIHPFEVVVDTGVITPSSYRSPLDLSMITVDGTMIFSNIGLYQYYTSNNELTFTLVGKNYLLRGVITRNGGQYDMAAVLNELTIDDSDPSKHLPVLQDVDTINTSIVFDSTSDVDYLIDKTSTVSNVKIIATDLIRISNLNHKVVTQPSTRCSLLFDVDYNGSWMKSLYGLSMDISAVVMTIRPVLSKEIFINKDLYTFCNEDSSNTTIDVEPYIITNSVITTLDDVVLPSTEANLLELTCYESKPSNISGIRPESNIYFISYNHVDGVRRGVISLNLDEYILHIDLVGLYPFIYTNLGVRRITPDESIKSIIPLLSNGLTVDLYEPSVDYKYDETKQLYDGKALSELLIGGHFIQDSYLMGYLGFDNEVLCNTAMMKTIIGYIKAEIVGDIVVDKHGNIKSIKGFAHVNQDFIDMVEA